MNIKVIILSLILLFSCSKAVKSENSKYIITVGSETMNLVDSSRVNPLYEGYRMLSLQMWYPIDSLQLLGVELAPYLAHINLLGQSMNSALSQIKRKHHFLMTNSLQNKKIKNGSYPIILFSPSLGGNLHYYSYIAEYLASRGYIVVGMNHRYESAYIFNENTVEYGNLSFHDDLKKLSIPDEITADAYRLEKGKRQKVLAEDMLFVLDKILDSKYKEFIDSNKIGLFGHSFGGAASVYAALLDSRIKAVINLDGTPPSIALENGIDQAFLFIEDLTDYKEHIGYKKLHKRRNDFCRINRSDSYRFLFKGFDHNSFLDTDMLLADSEKDFTLAQEKLEKVSKLMKEFFDVYVNASSSEFNIVENDDMEVFRFIQ